MDKNQLALTVEKYKDIIKIWAEGSDPLKRAIAETVLEAVEA